MPPSWKQRHTFSGVAAVLAVGLFWSVRPGLLTSLWKSYGWAHAYCYLGNSRLIAIHAVTDSLIYLSYTAISVTLAYLVYRTRREIPFSWMFLAFGTFIIACGFTHLMEVIVLWKPLYWMSGDVKLVTAVASIATAIAFPPLVPKVVEMVRSAKSSELRRGQLESAVAALDLANEDLQHEIQKRNQTEEMLRKLSGRVLAMQDDERRRLGRELHDSAGQILAALRINLGLIAQSANHNSHLTSALDETASLADQAIAEIRTLSYLLHPPMLDETGLASAIEWYVPGFSERSKVSVNLDIDPRLRRFPREVETTVFRILQECLVNIHRHSGSRIASISLRSTVSGLALAVRDEGRGIPAETIDLLETGIGDIGVGIRGMRERARQLGGSVEIRRANPGTLVAVNLPALKSVAVAQPAS